MLWAHHMQCTSSWQQPRFADEKTEAQDHTLFSGGAWTRTSSTITHQSLSSSPQST